MAAARYKMISIPDAQSIVLQHTPVLGKETIPLHAGVGRILAETVTAKDNLPPFPASIMVSWCTAPCDAPVGRELAKQLLSYVHNPYVYTLMTELQQASVRPVTAAGAVCAPQC